MGINHYVKMNGGKEETGAVRAAQNAERRKHGSRQEKINAAAAQNCNTTCADNRRRIRTHLYVSSVLKLMS